ncbi:MAG: hypothetical protein H3C31_03260 [Brumimicrobium sp.]|nr:hypothetical protein [Brumimicrobium sp.]MCO5268616.1 hypothetical protein [Brumimicrobium sp.]
MKNVKLILLAVIATLFLEVGNASAQENPSKTVIIRVTERRVGGNPAIVTTNPEGKTNIIQLEKGFDESGANALIIQKEIEKWKKEGYEIDGISSSVMGDVALITIIILSKKE